MRPRIARPSRVLVATVLFGALVLAAPGQAQTPSPAPAPAPTAQPGGDPVETRITQLHDQLKITAAQEAKWKAVAQVMRDNAKAMDALMKKRAPGAPMSALDDLKSYHEFTEAHAKGLKKLITAFEALYTAMPAPQKKNADQVFAQFQEPSGQPATGSGGSK
jgi:hypothetical protein